MESMEERKMKDKTPSVTVIIPAYNAESSLAGTLDSLLGQKNIDNIEIIVVDDGSIDGTATIGSSYESRYPNIQIISKSNAGVGAARNAGMDIAQGRYIAFLDSDDELEPDTLSAAVDLFDKHYDEIDLVTYPMKILKNGKVHSHFRESYFSKTGIYDLSDLRYTYGLITNVNVLVKNDDALPRFREDLLVHEDELFFIEIILNKQKVGFSNKGAYLYKQHAGSAIDSVMHPYYQFEDNIGFWEELFQRFEDNAPRYLQASFFNEISWKLRSDMLFPYHYEDTDFKLAVSRIIALLDRVETDTILASNQTDVYHKLYFFMQSSGRKIQCDVSVSGITILVDNKVLFHSPTIELYFVKARAENSGWRFQGFVKSPIFSIFSEAPELYLRSWRNDAEDLFALEIKETSWCHHRGKVWTNQFWGFDFALPFEEPHSFSFAVKVRDCILPAKVIFNDIRGLNSAFGRWSISKRKNVCSVDSSGAFHLNSVSDEGLRSELRRERGRVLSRNKKAYYIRRWSESFLNDSDTIWLYFDRGSILDNGYYQFIHDVGLNDRIKRYYVTSLDESRWIELFPSEARGKIVKFGTWKHKLLMLKASVLLMAYLESQNWQPFTKKALKDIGDLLRYRVVYLQHGLLHAHMPWKYSYDRLDVDYEVVSTQYEVDNLKGNYHFPEYALIRSGMPRYDFIEPAVKHNKRILFAPSWRKYLVHQTPKLDFEPLNGAFESSCWWNQVRSFLNDDSLHALLEKNDYELDVKLHPIFEVYSHYFNFDSARINIVNSVDVANYSVFITDYSSWVFDFVYQNTDIVYFLPDYDFFRSGLNGYKELDIPLEEGFGPLCKTGKELLANLIRIIERGEGSKYRSKQDFFFYYDDNQRDRLYKAVRSLLG